MLPVLIVGAGPTGLALACGLLAGGTAVRVVDQAEGPAVTSRALGLQPRGVEVLDRLGALGDLPERSVRLEGVVVRVEGREMARLRLGERTPLVSRPGLLVSQAGIEAQLRRRLADLGGAVEWRRELLSADQDRDGVTVRLDGEEIVRTGWLVGCDGAHSQVRKVAGIGFPGVAIIERFLLADVHADLQLPRDTVSVWLRGTDMLGAFPLPGADVWRLMAPTPADLPADPAPDEVLQVLARLLEEHSGYRVTVRSAEWVSTFRIHRRLADTYRRGRVLLAGDAAHIHSPLGGQGMNTGLSDAENLAWKLALVADRRADPALLDSYQDERRPIAAEVLASTSSMTALVVGANPLARAIRDHMFVPLLNRPRVQRFIWEHASQLKISYRRGPLAQRSMHNVAGLRPGDRVPDLRCLNPDCAPTRLHTELGGRWALLVPRTPAGETCAAVTRQQLGEKTVTVLTPADSTAGTALLVRPDAHLGWRGTPTPDKIEQWLNAVLEHGRAPGHDRQ